MAEHEVYLDHYGDERCSTHLWCSCGWLVYLNLPMTPADLLAAEMDHRG